jgi:negative regulator of sigma E activity
MGTDPFYEKLREISWRRKLNSAEEHDLREWLAAHPDAQESLDLETGLTEALRKMPDVPVASNFTARVLQAVEREAMVEARAQGSRWQVWRKLPRWLPKVAPATVVVMAGLLAYFHNNSVEAARQLAAAQSVAGVPLPSPEILTNFDAIRIVSATPAPDEQLLALFQ